MTPTEMRHLLLRLIDGWENETVEFKEGGKGFSTGEIGKYFSALANEANLNGVTSGWLVFGVRNRDRAIVGTDYRRDRERLQSLKNEIANGTETHATFREIHELDGPEGRVLMFEIPSAPTGIPLAWNGFYYSRNGESLAPLSLGKQDMIRGQGARSDWSAEIVNEAVLDDLDPEALRVARQAFAMRHSNRLSLEEIEAWATETFLEKLRLTIRGKLTRAAVLLLGKPDAAHLLSPLMAEITWKLTGEERAYEHFGLPFLLATTRAYERVRNYQIRMLQPSSLIQAEVSKYDRSSLLEAIHNCVAHSDYRLGGRIVLEEHHDRIVLTNMGRFTDGSPEDYLLDGRVPTVYRNVVLVNAMVELNMIDRLGSGIAVMARSQVRRFLPLPDFDLTEANLVRLTVYGAVIDTNFSQVLMSRTDLPMKDILSLDRVQKGSPVPNDELRRLRRLGLVEGRRPHLHVSAEIADVTDSRTSYMRTRSLDDKHYEGLIVEYLESFGEASRSDLDEFLLDKLSEALSPEEKYRKLSSLLTKLRRQARIVNTGSRKKSKWTLAENKSESKK